MGEGRYNGACGVGMYKGGIKIGYMCVRVWAWFCVGVGVSMYEGEDVRVFTGGNGLMYEKLPKVHRKYHCTSHKANILAGATTFSQSIPKLVRGTYLWCVGPP